MPKDFREEVADRFAFHPATEFTGPVHDKIRIKFGELAQDLITITPHSREQSLALTALQESMMWSNGAVAIHTPREQ